MKSTQRVRKWRESDPVRSCYQNLKDNCKRRSIEFDLELADFRLFCYESDYIKKKGRTIKHYSIDRLDETKGYHILNIRPLPVSDNSRRRFKKLEYDWETGIGFIVKVFGKIQDQREEEMPF